jgi:predicted extracellular nuclease
MQATVGTFNLNNLFSRFNFEADVSTASTSTVETETSFTFDDPAGFKLRTYKGRLVKEKPEAERKLIASRIKRMDLDVLAVQEVEDIDTLRHFVHENLDGLYKHSALIEGNDPRLIDVGLLSKRPLGGVTSWQHMADPLDASQPVFSRDLLQVEVLKENRKDRLFTVFVNHLKSHYVPFDVDDPDAEAERANKLRKRQCEVAAKIIDAEMRPNSPYLVVGDMNDPRTPSS